MSYANEGQLDRALKKALRVACIDPGTGYRQALRDRFLCRVFSDPESRFVLKGGSGLLARISDARATRDIDFATLKCESPESAVAALNSLVTKDMGDFLTFELTKCEECQDENGYSRLLKLRYATYLGHEEKDPILIDLALDCGTTLPPERIEPASRVFIEGLATSDYLVYPLPDQLADKLCAIMELQPGGWQSSRMKDLVDVVFYATNEPFLLGQLSYSIQCECARRGMAVPIEFAAPKAWESRFSVFAKNSGVAVDYASFPAACSLASKFYNPALLGEKQDVEATWNPERLCWEAGSDT